MRVLVQDRRDREEARNNNVRPEKSAKMSKKRGIDNTADI